MGMQSAWIDELWRQEPGVPIIGHRNTLTSLERKVLLALAQGGDNADGAKIAGVALGTFQTTVLAKMRVKLHAHDHRRMVAEGYRQGHLALEYPGDRPTPVELPEGFLDVWGLITEGYSNPDIAKRLGFSKESNVVRARVASLAVGLAVVKGIGGRTQVASRFFEFGYAEGDFSKKS